jgi:predicted DNA-binding protein (MmcQ/YjbR family)
VSVAEAVRDFALKLPGAVEEFPWGDRVAKVDKKIFVFLGQEDDTGAFGIGVKLPESGPAVLLEPYATPTAYNLGKAGWVTLQFQKGEHPPLDVLEAWVEESWRAIAPKKLVKARLTAT